MIPGVVVVLKQLSAALNKFGSGDRVNAPRVSKIVEAAGPVIGTAANVNDDAIKGARSECVDSVFKLLGSDSFRKDEEIGLSAGEALSIFASEYISKEPEVDLERMKEEWPSDLDETYAKASPPPVEVSQEKKSSSSYSELALFSFL